MNSKLVTDQSGNRRIDWHDYNFINYEKTRVGPGEMSPYILNDTKEIEESQKLISLEGVSVLKEKVAQIIPRLSSLNNNYICSCLDKKYLKNLPTVSVIVIFYNEPLSILLRCVSSIFYRSPRNLLHEIILVNDNSTKDELYKTLSSYVEQNFDGRVKVYNNPTRLGLIATRMEGAKLATGEVILFLDSHMEVTTNWLPPLLDPIVINRRTATVPTIDSINHENFKYEPLADNWNGGDLKNLSNYDLKIEIRDSTGFDWNLRYHYYVFNEEEYSVPGVNHLLSAMTGGAYAINREYFFELGGYDTGMFLYNGENYELSFKLQLCGGSLLKVPCSHVGHVSKIKVPYSRQMNGINHEMRNLRRVVEVWFDEYKFLFYRDHPERYQIDFGDISEQVSLRKSLNCKSFKYYLEVIAPFILDWFPIEKKPHFASGAIQSMANKNFCATEIDDKLNLVECSENLTNPSSNQYFLLTWKRTLEPNNEYDLCLSLSQFTQCTHRQGDQLFRYLLDTQQIKNPNSDKCLMANFDLNIITLEKCNSTEVTQKWDFGYKNTTALRDWHNVGIKLLTNE
ncbi:CLUMA_CG000813, isoform A [Clunio marinus]|uniref:Polypeptide N-acetylgalactosaminyltransferase n=1 Tax=Clunio marinus TaxID=568069 RepID=A0A1J1HG73_9DIPT|nr:CLUMA_CG000813, isoform A [Clunio marinus]